MQRERDPAAAQGRPLFVVDAGDLGWKSAVIGASVLDQQREKLDLQLHAFSLAGIDAWTPGEGDLALGLDAVRDTAARYQVPVVASNLVCGGQAPFPAGRVVEHGGVKVGVVAVIDPALLATSSAAECSASEPVAALEMALAALGPVDAVVVLSHMGGQADGTLLPALPHGALVVNGHAGLTQTGAVALGAGTVQLAAGSRGKSLGLAEIAFTAGAEGFRGEAASGVQGRLERYRDRLDKARQDLLASPDGPAHTRAQRQVDFYERETAKLDAQLKAAAASADAPRNPVQVRMVELGTDIQDDAPTLALVEQAKAGMNKLATERGGRVAVLPGRVQYLGSSTCKRCHEAEYAQWKDTPHARAWAELLTDNRQLDDACWRCHVTGAFDSRGPQHPLQVGASLQGVGCESCHGPGKDHVAHPTAENIDTESPPTAATCTQCHDGVQDEGRFAVDQYWPRIIHKPVGGGGG